MTDELTPREIFLASVNRCTDREEFIPTFYKRFLGSSNEIEAKFLFTDFDKQNKMLARSLELCAGATAGDPEALAEISERACTHSRTQLNIEPRLYDIWLETLVGTASEIDDEWSDMVEAAWRRILGHVIHHMTRQYE